METILVVDDDHAVQKALRHLFEDAGYRVEVCGDGESALDVFRTAPATAIILDLGLPLLSGVDVCREIRQVASSLPIVVLSARADDLDKILLLELGADDYVTKPFSPRELLARVRAAIRRIHGDIQVPDCVEFGSVRVDFLKMEASFSGRDIHLTEYEFRMLRFLVQKKGMAVQRDEILTEVFGLAGSTQSRSMDNIIMTLRKKLESDPESPVHILTVRNVGYRFVV
jgi:DNA-binding response OmpR family regulator